MVGERWGVTDAEVASRFACDDLVTDPVLACWRGVSVAAPPEVVWPWVTQIRVAPYSYDLLDNLGRRSPRRLLGLDPPRVGEPFTATAGRPQGEVLAVDPGRQLTGRILGAVMSYRLDPTDGVEGAAGTRLLIKLVMARGRALAPVVAVGDLVMARRQLLTLRDLAEASRTA
ncbi:SRPBCC family protein [Phycicoccus sp. BSK3Z-2]|uniref:SRPBCC family protein n=1 Tax=Phycicoccus avicenniae TaxID=2828860 RepID=A0A941HZL7_9MICO|nr:SRPBCC family protein [Phycicoccus avicenniae]MBR7743107.1 SRPBCC family protein [Phycicoccus avicenniae]